MLRKPYYTQRDLETKVKPGSLIFPCFSQNSYYPASSWGSTDLQMQTENLVPFQAALKKLFIRGHTKQLETYLNEWSTPKQHTCAKVHRMPTDVPMNLAENREFHFKYGNPIGLYLGEIVQVTRRDRFYTKLLGPDGSIIWF